MDPKTLQTILLHGIWDEYMDALNLIGVRDVYKSTYDEIFGLCIQYSRGKVEHGKGSKNNYQFIKSAKGGATK